LVTTNKHLGVVIELFLYKDDIYRVVSEQELSEDLLESLGYFSKGVQIIHRFHWDFAYPSYEKFEGNLTQLPDFILDDNGLYYISAIEAAASCVELSMISARNIVNIIENKISNI
jgi:hypothetical protein